jgi:hypothetical protein
MNRGGFSFPNIQNRRVTDQLCATLLPCFFHNGGRLKPTKRKVSCTFKREIPLEIQERIYSLH